VRCTIDAVVHQVRLEIAERCIKMADERGEPPLSEQMRTMNSGFGLWPGRRPIDGEGFRIFLRWLAPVGWMSDRSVSHCAPCKALFSRGKSLFNIVWACPSLPGCAPALDEPLWRLAPATLVKGYVSRIEWRRALLQFVTPTVPYYPKSYSIPCKKRGGVSKHE